MKKAFLILLLAGAFGLVAFLVSTSPREPVYDREPLSYWMAHWYWGNGPQLAVNPSAKAAIREAGTNALPFLMKWLRMRGNSSPDYHRPTWALHGFEGLGPAAKAAIPELVALLGERNVGNYPSIALAYIGPDAVPALTNVLRTNHVIRARRNALEALSSMGTDAVEAVPILITLLKHPSEQDRWAAAMALAEAGRNQPEVVVPVLAIALTNPINTTSAVIAEALGSFGESAKDAAPALRFASLHGDANVRSQAAAALQKTSPQTKDALEPLRKP
jgi:hypothetical protein